jgi:hypothetical protein
MGFEQIAAWVAKTQGNIEKVVEDVRIEVSREIVIGTPEGGPGTPVLTGNARGGWQPSIGSAISVDLTPPEFYANYPKGRHANLDPTGANVMARVENLAVTEHFKDFYLANNVKYIIPLEDGSSMQAPNGMMRVGVMSFNRKVEEAIAILPK